MYAVYLYNIRYNPMHPLQGAPYLCRMCQCGLHVMLWSCIGIFMRLFDAEPSITAGLLFPSQYHGGTTLLTLDSMMWDTSFKSRAQKFFIGITCSLHFCPLLFFLSFYVLVLWSWVFGLIRCKSLSPGLALPTFFK